MPRVGSGAGVPVGWAPPDDSVAPDGAVKRTAAVAKASRKRRKAASGTDATARVDPQVAAQRMEACLELARQGHFDLIHGALRSHGSNDLSDQERVQAYVSRLSELTAGLRASVGATGTGSAASSASPRAVAAVQSWAGSVATYMAHLDGGPASTWKQSSLPPEFKGVAHALSGTGLSDSAASDLALSLVVSVHLGATMSAAEPTAGAGGALIRGAASDIGGIVDATVKTLTPAQRARVSGVQDKLTEALGALHDAVRAQVGQSLMSAGLMSQLHARVESQFATLPKAAIGATGESDREREAQRAARRLLEREAEDQRLRYIPI